MIVCRYRKRGTYAFVPHVDVLRALCMAIRRSRADIAFSEGFNPHMLLKLSSPLPLGVESDCEYLAAASTDAPDAFAEKLNRTLPDELRILCAARADRANPAADIAAAEYEIVLPGFDCAALARAVTEADAFAVSYTDRGETVTRDVRARIYSLSGAGDILRAVLGYGNANVRADRLAAQLCGGRLPKNAVILKKKMYTMLGGGLVDADKIYFGGTAIK